MHEPAVWSAGNFRLWNVDFGSKVRFEDGQPVDRVMTAFVGPDLLPGRLSVLAVEFDIDTL